ncbi:MAG TPA: hypothetical protein VLE19_03525, partial [Pyrinomonadaceae bacterium]|nr:hypothetical protein [Pyrinomonadaceae bacterium]
MKLWALGWTPYTRINRFRDSSETLEPAQQAREFSHSLWLRESLSTNVRHGTDMLKFARYELPLSRILV